MIMSITSGKLEDSLDSSVCSVQLACQNKKEFYYVG